MFPVSITQEVQLVHKIKRLLTCLQFSDHWQLTVGRPYLDLTDELFSWNLCNLSNSSGSLQLVLDFPVKLCSSWV